MNCVLLKAAVHGRFVKSRRIDRIEHSVGKRPFIPGRSRNKAACESRTDTARIFLANRFMLQGLERNMNYCLEEAVSLLGMYLMPVRFAWCWLLLTSLVVMPAILMTARADAEPRVLTMLARG